MTRAHWPRAPQAYRPPQPERNRLILALWAQGGWSFATLGEHLGISRNTVAGVVDRDRRRLRAKVFVETPDPARVAILVRGLTPEARP